MTSTSLQLPPSGIALRVLVDALGIRSAIEERKCISPHSVSAVLSGKPVKRATRDEFVRALIEVLWTEETSSALFRRDDLHHDWIALALESVSSALDAWDAARGQLSAGHARVTRDHEAVLPWARLAAIDLGLRWGFFLLASGTPVPRRETIEAILGGKAFASTLQWLREEADLTREALAQKTRSDPRAWLSGSRLPHFSNLPGIAEVLAASLAGKRHLGDRDRKRLATTVRFQLVAARAASALHGLVSTRLGEDWAKDLALGCAYLVRFVHSFVAQKAPKDAEGFYWYHVATGVRGDWSNRVLAAAAENVQFPHEAFQLRGAAGDWSTAILRCYRELATPDSEWAASLTAVLGSASESEARHIKDLLLRTPKVKPKQARDPEIDRAVAKVANLDDAPAMEERMIQAQHSGDLVTWVAAARRLVKLHPEVPKYHLWLGDALAQSGAHAEALFECHVADQLAGGWIIAAAEVGIVHLRAGRNEEALSVLARVAETYVATEPDPKLAAHVLYHQGEALLRLGRPRDAVPVLTTAFERYPENAATAERLAHALLLTGDRTNGREVAKRAAHLGMPQVLKDLEDGRY
ncbi:tetratricopeptide repeat protein [Anaeromyxobacter oryzae]|uniref:Tetratricopeptide repeat protein n=1 Tax=Anaeromyxobacter oryzae TaxID=2918170 RepID=A0ABM7WTJ8_9BACT|nr:tetratricopeptide repeat protein [Anaeromyxobacter oryzae]BDG02813.1 hypothetical protein AMOR_18090 [Anaeromyxobacter oryzae]